MFRDSRFLRLFSYFHSVTRILKQQVVQKPDCFRFTVHRCSWKQVILKILQYSQENNCVGVSFLKICVKVLYQKEIPTQAFSCKYCEILNPLNTSPTKWSNTLKQFAGNLQTNCLSVFDYFVKLAVKGLRTAFVINTDGCFQPDPIIYF